MYKVKTFTTPLEIFRTQGELTEIDERVNSFLATQAGVKVISISDSTTIDNGATIGLMRTVAYEAGG